MLLIKYFKNQRNILNIYVYFFDFENILYGVGFVAWTCWLVSFSYSKLLDSGMKVNESKTDLCLFHRGDSTPIISNLKGVTFNSNRTINVLGVIFESKLQWADHIAHAIKRSTKALNAIILIKKNLHEKNYSTWGRQNIIQFYIIILRYGIYPPLKQQLNKACFNV